MKAKATLDGYPLDYRQRRVGEVTYTWVYVEIEKQWHKLGRWSGAKVSPGEISGAIKQLVNRLKGEN
jgi:hypothetical protein